MTTPRWEALHYIETISEWRSWKEWGELSQRKWLERLDLGD